LNPNPSPLRSESSAQNQRVVIRSVALPSEHGGWGFLLEPILLGLLVAGSVSGILLAISAVGVFLIHQPLKVALKDRLKRRRPVRTIWAERFVVIYGLIALVPFIVLLLTTDRAFLLPVALAVPFAAVQLYFDSRNQSRRLIPEIGGALALAMIAPAIAVLAGWQLLPALTLWLLLALRAVPSILYVRARLQLERDHPIVPLPVWMSHAAAVGVSIALSITGAAPSSAIIACCVLLIRSVVGLSRYRKPRPAKIIGMQELGYGLLTVILIAVGYTLIG
jgi:hypothetical protein